MTIDKKFYIIEGLGSINSDKNMKSAIRVAAIPDNFPFLPSNIVGHCSLRHLRQYDAKWKQLKSRLSKTADKICQEEYIFDFHDFVLTPNNEKFNQYSYDLLQHSIHGKYGNDFQGLHLLTKHNKDIIGIEETKTEDENGVWEARVKVFNKRRNKTYEKLSTFFPKSWTPSHFMFETFYAIEKIKIEPTITEYISSTLSGIPVVVVIKENRAKTIYPTIYASTQ